MKVSWRLIQKIWNLGVARTTETASIMKWFHSTHDPAWKLIWVLTLAPIEDGMLPTLYQESKTMCLCIHWVYGVFHLIPDLYNLSKWSCNLTLYKPKLITYWIQTIYCKPITHMFIHWTYLFTVPTLTNSSVLVRCKQTSSSTIQVVFW